MMCVKLLTRSDEWILWQQEHQLLVADLRSRRRRLRVFWHCFNPVVCAGRPPCGLTPSLRRGVKWLQHVTRWRLTHQLKTTQLCIQSTTTPWGQTAAWQVSLWHISEQRISLTNAHEAKKTQDKTNQSRSKSRLSKTRLECSIWKAKCPE